MKVNKEMDVLNQSLSIMIIIILHYITVIIITIVTMTVMMAAGIQDP